MSERELFAAKAKLAALMLLAAVDLTILALRWPQ